MAPVPTPTSNTLLLAFCHGCCRHLFKPPQDMGDSIRLYKQAIRSYFLCTCFVQRPTNHQQARGGVGENAGRRNGRTRPRGPGRRPGVPRSQRPTNTPGPWVAAPGFRFPPASYLTGSQFTLTPAASLRSRSGIARGSSARSPDGDHCCDRHHHRGCTHDHHPERDGSCNTANVTG